MRCKCNAHKYGLTKVQDRACTRDELIVADIVFVLLGLVVTWRASYTHDMEQPYNDKAPKIVPRHYDYYLHISKPIARP